MLYVRISLYSIQFISVCATQRGRGWLCDVFCVGFRVWALFETFPDPLRNGGWNRGGRGRHEMDGMPSVRTYVRTFNIHTYARRHHVLVLVKVKVYGPHAYYAEKKRVYPFSYGYGPMGRLVAV